MSIFSFIYSCLNYRTVKNVLEKGVKGEEQGTGNKEQRTENKEQRAKNREQGK